ncbi:MAG TPA: DUF3616 domain-containing protein [Verrucomicrobiae bacterium]|nr:DUF3616 domain-containing protein [Verrucomicrobiae bacterium]
MESRLTVVQKHILIATLVAAAACGKAATAQLNLSAPTVYSGICDASAAVALGNRLFVAANDEDNQLRIYDRDRGGPPIHSIDLSTFLQADRQSPEADLEGAARVGNRIYWISSHGRNQNGKRRPGRERFFATEIRTNQESIELTPTGKPYRNLLRDLVNEPKLKAFNLGDASRLAPKEPNAFNIEGLCATPEGHLLIGFRNPVPRGKALLVPLLNPAELVEGRSPKFGEPLLLNLNGLGIREISRHEGRNLVVAGSFDGAGKSHLYEWDGRSPAAIHLGKINFGKFNPEAVIFYPDRAGDEIQVLSDDGNVAAGGKKCKDLKDPSERTFRGLWLREAGQ